MGQAYDHLTLEERCELARRREAGETIRQIAAALGRSPSSICRELKRNGAPKAAYKPVLAGDLNKARRWRGSRLERDEVLQGQVLEHLALGWSPEQVAGRLKRERGQAVISHESIYRFIYAQMRRTNDGSWRKYLPRKTNLDTLDLDDILWLNRLHNHRPRKCLVFQTPAEVYAPLHFKCESTSRLSSGRRC